MHVKNPEFRRIDNFRLKNMGLTQATIGLNTTYYNPNNFGVTVKEAWANLYMDSVYLGKFLQDSTVFVDRNAEFSIPLSGAITLQSALKLNFKNLRQRELLFRADGSVKVGKAGIFVTRPFQYEGKHRLEDIDIFK